MEQDTKAQTQPSTDSSKSRVREFLSDLYKTLFASEITVSRNSTVTVTSPHDGSTISATRRELEKNGELQEALHRVEHIPSDADPSQETQVWERRFPETQGKDERPCQTPRDAVLSHPEAEKKSSEQDTMGNELQANGRVVCQGGVYVSDGQNVKQLVDVQKDVTYTNHDVASMAAMMSNDVQSTQRQFATAVSCLDELAKISARSGNTIVHK